jgi:hypothetical protein
MQNAYAVDTVDRRAVTRPHRPHLVQENPLAPVVHLVFPSVPSRARKPSVPYYVSHQVSVRPVSTVVDGAGRQFSEREGFDVDPRGWNGAGIGLVVSSSFSSSWANQGGASLAVKRRSFRRRQVAKRARTRGPSLDAVPIGTPVIQHV